MEKSKKDNEAKDVEMTVGEEEAGNDKAEGGDEAKPKQQAQKDKDLLTFEDVREQMKLIERGVNQKEVRYINRALRGIQSLRKKTNDAILRRVTVAYYPATSPLKEQLLDYLDEPMDGEEVSQYRPRSSKTGQPVILPELDIFVHLLILLRMLDQERMEKAKKCSDALMEKVVAENRRTLDGLSAKCYFYHSRVYEMCGQLAGIRGFLHARLRTATLRHNEEAQAVLMNLLLRNYLHHNLYDQADKLVSKSKFPESANNNEIARQHYYLGRIKAIQLEYSEAYTHLVQAIRKAPASSAVGFRQTANKFAVVVQLLLGQIPDRSTFRDPILRRPLAPYFKLTQAVRNGDLELFSNTLDLYGAQFHSERTYTLIVRLRHNVIKTGVRMISLSYSRVSLEDIAEKLKLDSSIDAEYIVAKAIRDGVIEATIDHEQGFMQSKAMRYPPKAYRKDFQSVEERREREQQDLELAKEMAEEDDEEFP
ncbi:26S proteasome non-ATPase regulatory subunit 3 [Geodia barretti]|uniref:26S proteasome non-ATPase regulatory subunit 3 n=1 Tax=Geodia barretti TaxID=519541 RepID=A0AA35WX64_GEOBA|nr:26S proteasome non-ATPase regulatory subunit 3 [Geodia barretti]